MPEIYCIDTSSLIRLNRDLPQDVFPGVWEKIDVLADSGRLVAPTEVLREIEQGDDELVSWARRHRRIFRQLDAGQIAAAMEILARFPSLVDESKETPEADPFLVALAKAENDAQKSSLMPERYVLVTEERRKGIPLACSRYEIECINLLELFRREGWRFRS